MDSNNCDLIFLRPQFHNKIWGGRSLQKEFGYRIPDGPVGECWAISAHNAGDCRIIGGEFDSLRLSYIYQHNPEVFGNIAYPEFPLLIKYLDAADDLSIQVHPDDAYAQEVEKVASGKQECWYILDAKPGATIIVGQNAHDKEEFQTYVNSADWKELLHEIPIEKGDFFQIDPGTVHAIKAGTLVLEIQQSCDITYRVYDYNRPQKDGTLRDLHLRQSMDVIDFDQKVQTKADHPTIVPGQITNLVRCANYSVDILSVDKSYELKNTHPFICVNVLQGTGKVCGHYVSKGDNFIVPHMMDNLIFEGDLVCALSYIK